MSNKRDIEIRLNSLEEIKEIMGAMKNLSLMEVHRLARFLACHDQVVGSVAAAAADFLQFHRHLLADMDEFRDLHLLIGSERGFCGDFNDRVIESFDRRGTLAGQESAIVVGTKLAGKLSGDKRLRAVVDGASVVEEVDRVLGNVMRALTGSVVAGKGELPLRVTVYHVRPEQEEVAITTLQPWQADGPKGKIYAEPPLLYLSPSSFLSALLEHYLYATLFELLGSSLMAEHQRRMQQMDLAERRLAKNCADLLRKRNIIRQEEITEEIEVIMLSVKDFD